MLYREHSRPSGTGMLGNDDKRPGGAAERTKREILLRLFRGPMSWLFPDPTNKLKIFFTLVALDVLLMLADAYTGENVSLRPLFLVPVVLSGLLNDRNYVRAFCLITALLFAESFRLSHFSDRREFNYLMAMLPALIAYGILAELSLFSMRTLQKMGFMLLRQDKELRALRQARGEDGDASG